MDRNEKEKQQAFPEAKAFVTQKSLFTLLIIHIWHQRIENMKKKGQNVKLLCSAFKSLRILIFRN